MTDELALFARTFVIGVAVAAPVGAMGVLCAQRTLERGVGAGLATGLGIATADALFAGVAAFGVSALSEALVAWQTPLRIVGGIALVYLGLTAALRSHRTVGERSAKAQQAQACVQEGIDLAVERDSQAPPASSGPTLWFASAVGLTLTNPMTIMAFGAIFASAGLAAAPGTASALVATAGVATGSLSWWLVLVTGVSLAHRSLGDGFVVWVGRLSGVVIAAFGALALGSAVLRLQHWR